MSCLNTMATFCRFSTPSADMAPEDSRINSYNLSSSTCPLSFFICPCMTGSLTLKVVPLPENCCTKSDATEQFAEICDNFRTLFARARQSSPSPTQSPLPLLPAEVEKAPRRAFGDAAALLQLLAEDGRGGLERVFSPTFLKRFGTKLKRSPRREVTVGGAGGWAAPSKGARGIIISVAIQGLDCALLSSAKRGAKQ